MAPISIIDSHIHLWPASAANSAGHAWMEEGFILTKEHVLSDYYKAARQNQQHDARTHVQGVVYLETDRRLGDPKTGSLQEWAAQPLEEIKLLTSMVEGQNGSRDSSMLLGLVPWAPVDQGWSTFEQWLKLAEATAGSNTWQRVKGFRSLLQAITDRNAFESLVCSDDFISILRSLNNGQRRFSFDVGIDQHSGGIWQLETFAGVVDRLYEGVAEDRKVTLVFNHLCKPDMTIDAASATKSDDFQRWGACMKRFARHSSVYMKLSGGFSELRTGRTTSTSPEDLADRMKPWLDAIFDSFPPERLMFGSDWPVCNVRGPSEEDSWTVWQRVVETALQRRQLDETQKQMIWSQTAIRAYRLRE